MKLKKLSLPVLALALTACSTQNITSNPATSSEVNFKSTMTPGTVINQEKNEVFVADLGNGKKGATMSFTMRLDESNFGTKSTNGVSRGTFAMIKAIKIGITTNRTTPASGFIGGTGTELTTASLLPSNTTAKVYTFTNVPVGTGYNIAVQFNGGSASPFNDNLLNMTTHTTGWALSAAGDAKDVALDAGSGATVVVDAGTSTENLNDIPVSVQLRDEVAASITSSVTVTEGTAASGTIAVSSS